MQDEPQLDKSTLQTAQQPLSAAQPQEAQPSTQQSASGQRDRGLEIVLPINRNGMAIAAGYVALFNFPFFITAPVALGLGIAALVSLSKHPEKAGRGRAWFAVIYSALTLSLALYIIGTSVARDSM